MSPEAIAARQRRSTEWETRRFNNTMKEYLEIKHSNIYDEYCLFYRSLAAKYPNKKNLLKTVAFKTWRKAEIEQSFEKDGVRAVVTDFGEPSDQESEVSTTEFANFNGDEENREDVLSEAINSTTEFANFNGDEENREDVLSEAINSTTEFANFNGDEENREDVLSVAINETLADQRLDDLNEIHDADNVIQGIIAELEQDAEVRDILAGGNADEVQQPNEDEGIALDYEIELNTILEPFDYELEIDW